MMFCDDAIMHFSIKGDWKMFVEFLSYLSERFYKENDLSDITAAMIKSVPGFGKCFFKLFNACCPDAPVDVFREVRLDDGYRIDLVLICGNNALYIENKIFDMNYHFDTYPQRIKADAVRRILTGEISMGLISNHHLNNSDYLKARNANFKIKYWEDLVNYLDAEYKYETDEFKKAMVKGYIKYVKGVCSMVDLNKVDVEGIKYAFFLKTMLLDVIQNNCSIDGFYCKYYPHGINRASGDNYFGVYYELAPETEMPNAKSAWVFIGVFFNENKGYAPSIVSWLDYEWNKEIISKMKRNGINTHSYYDNEWEEDDIVFSMPQELFEEFQNSNESKQVSILGNFYTQVNQAIIKCGSSENS